MPMVRLIANGLVLLMLAACAHAGEAVSPPQRAIVRMDTVVRDVAVSGDGRNQTLQRRFEVVVLENRYLQVLVCPVLGERIVNIIDKTTGRKCLYEGLIRYSGDAYTEGSGSGGGLGVNHPLYHAGSGYTAPLPYTTEITDDGTAVLTMAYTSYPHLQQTVWRISLHPDEAAVRCSYRFDNFAPFAMGFNPWINASFPMSDDAQFTLPADWIAGHWFGINFMGGEGDYGHYLKLWPVGTDGKDQSYLVNRKWSAAFAYGLTDGYAGVYYHDTNTGFGHVFDPHAMPGAKAAGAWSPGGWLEVWGAFTHNMEDPRWLGPHESIEASDMWFPLHGIGGMTWAGEHAALNLKMQDGLLHCGVQMLRESGQGALRVVVDGTTLLQTRLELNPGTPFFRSIPCPAETDEVRVLVMDSSGKVLLDRQHFFSQRPRTVLELPEKPWHRKTLTTEARWQEAFTPLMAWGPWYHPPSTYAKALADNPDDVEAALGLARSLIKEAGADLFRKRRDKRPAPQQYDRPADLLVKLAAAPDADARAIRLLALVQLRTGRPDEAAATLARLAGTPDDSAIVHYQLGLLAAAADQWPRAVTEAQAAVALAPDSVLSRLLLATALLATQRAGDVRGVLDPVLAANPVDIRALLLLRSSAESAGQADQVQQLSAALSRLEALGKVQYQAAVAAIEGLKRGSDLDHFSVDTTIALPGMPGSDP